MFLCWSCKAIFSLLHEWPFYSNHIKSPCLAPQRNISRPERWIWLRNLYAICGPAANPISTCSFPNSQSFFVQITDRHITQPFIFVAFNIEDFCEYQPYFLTLVDKSIADLCAGVRTCLWFILFFSFSVCIEVGQTFGTYPNINPGTFRFGKKHLNRGNQASWEVQKCSRSDNIIIT